MAIDSRTRERTVRATLAISVETVVTAHLHTTAQPTHNVASE